MSSLLYLTTQPTSPPTAWRGRVQSESALRVAAATLRQATSAEIGATRVVCEVSAHG
ncbi:MAG: hypothetical protein JOZ81_13065 [Chloroflexi bacterium]|nr:hypothetical protein [Chloroflexota bacterium]